MKPANTLAQALLRPLHLLAGKVRGWMSALLAAFAFSAEGLLHTFNIPHVEGWWLPLMGSGFAATAVGLWLQKWHRPRS